MGVIHRKMQNSHLCVADAVTSIGATIKVVAGRGKPTHERSVMSRMRMPETEDDHRRVLAVVAFLEARLTGHHVT